MEQTNGMLFEVSNNWIIIGLLIRFIAFGVFLLLGFKLTLHT